MSGIGWTTPDPLADKYYSISPDAFCNNNPVNFVDPDGADPTLAARIVIGATVGGLVSGTAVAIKGKSFTEVVAATAGGAADGAVSALGGKIASKLLSGIDDLSNFKGRDYGGHSVPENGIESRVLKLAIPEGATQSQLDQLMRLIDYAQQNNVQLNIVLAK